MFFRPRTVRIEGFERLAIAVESHLNEREELGRLASKLKAARIKLATAIQNHKKESNHAEPESHRPC